VRENRTHGSEGGEDGSPSLPLSRSRSVLPHRLVGGAGLQFQPPCISPDISVTTPGDAGLDVTDQCMRDVTGCLMAR
jgi:hypothetical protein